MPGDDNAGHDDRIEQLKAREQLLRNTEGHLKGEYQYQSKSMRDNWSTDWDKQFGWLKAEDYKISKVHVRKWGYSSIIYDGRYGGGKVN